MRVQKEDLVAPVGAQRIERPTGDPDDPARYWRTAGSDVIVEPLLARLLAYWQSKRSDGRLPSRTEIDPLDIPWALDRIYLLDRVPPPAVWRYRLAGARIEETFGVNTLRGATFEDFLSPAQAGLLRGRWQPLIDRRCAVYMHGTIYRTAERLPVGGRLLLPLGDGCSEEIVGVIGMTAGEWQTQAPGGGPGPGLDIHYIAVGGD